MFKRFRLWLLLLVVVIAASSSLLAQSRQASVNISLDSPASLPSDI